MKFAHKAGALLALLFLGCGARTSLEFGVGDAVSGSAGVNSSGGFAERAGASGHESRGGHGGASGAAGFSDVGGFGGTLSVGGAGGHAGSPACRPTGPETCDGTDNDCNGIVDDGNVCPCSTQTFRDRTFLFCLAVAAWSDAEQSCAVHGYHLASIGDGAEDDWLEQTVATYANSKWWIGLSDLQQPGVWRWQDGTPVSYVHWASGEPNNAGGTEFCAQLNRFGPGSGWNDEPCDGALPFVCKSRAP